MSKAQLPPSDVTRRIGGEDEDGHPHDDVFEMLSSARRRHVVHYLQHHGEEVSLRELSRQLAAWENDVTLKEVTSKQRKRVYTSLHQSHLPKLDDHGVIEYDNDRSVVRPTNRLDELSVYMEIVPENEIPWSVYYTGLGLFCGSLLLAKAVGLFPFSEVSAFAWGAVTVVLLIASGIVHVVRSRSMKLGSDESPPGVRSRGD